MAVKGDKIPVRDKMKLPIDKALHETVCPKCGKQLRWYSDEGDLMSYAECPKCDLYFGMSVKTVALTIEEDLKCVI